MRSCQIVEPGQIRIIDQPRPGEVLVRITAAGICGTDIHIYEGHYGSLPITPGHDVAGIIEAAGDKIPAGRIGSRVTIDPAGCCARSAISGELCPACQRGATNLCSSGTYMGMSAPGAMAEFVAVPAARTINLPNEIDDDAATALEPVVVGLHLKEQIEDRPGSLISHHFPAKDIARAFEISSRHQNTVSRSVLDMTAW